MVDSYLVKSLKRVHDQAAGDLKIIEPTSSATTAERFNDVLEGFKDEYPDNETLREIDEVEGRQASLRRGNHETAKEDLREIKLKTEQIADLFDLDVEDFAAVDDDPQMRPIVIHQEANQEVTAEQQQSVEQDVNVTVESVHETIQHIQLPPDQKDDLRELVDEFEEELNGDQDEEALQQLLGKAANFSEDVASQMAQRALMYGVTGILSFAA